jgi:hypothetical protein
MIKCRPYYLPYNYFVAVYLPPQTDVGTKTIFKLYRAISKPENAHPEAALLLANDFNVGKLKSLLPACHIATRGDKTQDHLYSTHRIA